MLLDGPSRERTHASERCQAYRRGGRPEARSALSFAKARRPTDAGDPSRGGGGADAIHTYILIC
eukprot:7833420-Pyramimonas_sp.AAC.1